MLIEVHHRAGGSQTLSSFADKHGLTMVVRERPGHPNSSSRYYAKFDGVDIQDNGVLIGAIGNGPTPEAAINYYAEEIVGKRLVKDAWRPTRYEFDAPNEFVKERFI